MEYGYTLPFMLDSCTQIIKKLKAKYINLKGIKI